MNSHQRHIEELAGMSLQSIGCSVPPVPVEKIIEKVGLRLIFFDFAKQISGILKKEKKVIAINKNHPALRQRFTMAHELGHFLLGHETSGPNGLAVNEEDFIDDRFDRPVPLEREANVFASFLLMPGEWVKTSINQNGMNIKRLANEFQVSEQAMTIRLLELNLIK